MDVGYRVTNLIPQDGDLGHKYLLYYIIQFPILTYKPLDLASSATRE